MLSLADISEGGMKTIVNCQIIKFFIALLFALTIINMGEEFEYALCCNVIVPDLEEETLLETGTIRLECTPCEIEIDKEVWEDDTT